jgi:uncharacterized protein (TIGR02246 family)
MNNPKLAIAIILTLSILTTSCAKRMQTVTTPLAKTCHNITKKEVSELFDRWNDSLKTGKSEEVAANYTDDAYLLPTLSNQPRTSHKTIESYFDEFLKKSPTGVINSSTIINDCNTVIDSGTYTFTLTDETNGTKTQAPARYTFVYVYDAKSESWLIKSHHSSQAPSK